MQWVDFFGAICCNLALVWAGRREPARTLPSNRRLLQPRNRSLTHATKASRTSYGEEAPEGLIDFEMKTPDSFTVIRLWPDRPPTSKTVHGKVPSTIPGTPTMAISGDGRWAHYQPRFPAGIIRARSGTLNQQLTNDDIHPEDMSKQKLAPPRSKMVSMINLASPEFRVVNRVLFR